MHPIGTKVIHLLTGDYGFVVEAPLCYRSINIFKEGWVLWLSGKDTSGRVLWEDPKKLYPVELEKEI